MKISIFCAVLIIFVLGQSLTAQVRTSQIPNADFENWIAHTGYSDPQYWDTPNEELMSIPFFGVNVVTKSTSHQSGEFSAKLETKRINIPGSPIDVPGVITLGKLIINITSGTYEITGGAPISDQPTHLKGFFRFSPQGGDSCAIGIILFKTVQGVRDTIAIGYFSSKVEVPDWTPFYAWINYSVQTNPDTMNILAISSAQFDMTPGTALYVDNLSLDYTLGIDGKTGPTGISVYQDKETRRLLVFSSTHETLLASVKLYNLMGQVVFMSVTNVSGEGKTVVPYNNLGAGIYILEVLVGDKRYCKKFFLNP